MTSTSATSRGLTQGIILFTAVFLIFAVVVGLLARFGLADSTAAVIFIIFTLTTTAVAAFAGRTMDLAAFQVASRAIAPFHAGLALAAIFLSGTGFLGLAAAIFAFGEGALAIVAGWSLGLLVLALLIAPFFRRSGAVTTADFLAIRYGGRPVRLAGGFLIILVCFLFLCGEMRLAGRVFAALLDVEAGTGIIIIAATILIGPTLGGVRAVIVTATACCVIMLLAFVAPVSILAVRDFATPFVPLAYGDVLAEIARLGDSLPAAEPGLILPLGVLDNAGSLIVMVSLAAGIAAMPHLLSVMTVTRNPRRARISVGWALGFLIPIAACAPAYALFARLASFSDPAVDTDMVVMALPRIGELPEAMTALIASGVIAAIIAAGSALLLTIGQTLGHDLYAATMSPKASASRRLITTRLCLAGVCMLSAYAANALSDRAIALPGAALGIAAAGLFPAIVLGILWERANAAGALAGMIAGFLTAAAYLYASLFPGAEAWHFFGPGIPPGMGAALTGLLAGGIVMILTSLATPRSEEHKAILAAIRSPAKSALLDDRGV